MPPPTFNEVKEEQGVDEKQPRTAAKADTIAHATKKVITEKMDEDPAFYEKFSILIQRAIEDFRAKRLSDLDYLNRVVDIRNKIVGKVHDDVPSVLKGKEDAQAYFGVVKPFFVEHEMAAEALESIAADTALVVDRILQAHIKVSFWDDSDAQKDVIDAIDDYCFDKLRAKRGLELSLDQMDAMIEKVMQVARSRG
jgi:type I restriction enzyme R subunit